MSTTYTPTGRSHELSLADLDGIGRTIDTAGFGAVPTSVLDDVVGFAQRHHLRPVATSVLADPRAPAVARVRAFGLVAIAVARHMAMPERERSAA